LLGAAVGQLWALFDLAGSEISKATHDNKEEGHLESFKESGKLNWKVRRGPVLFTPRAATTIVICIIYIDINI